VNTAATALSQNMKVLMTSANSRALQAFVEKLPEGIRDLCLDFSSCVEGGQTELRDRLERIQRLLQHTQRRLGVKENDIEVRLNYCMAVGVESSRNLREAFWNC
jgi:hypothetical protein